MQTSKTKERSIYLVAACPVLLWLCSQVVIQTETQVLQLEATPSTAVSVQQEQVSVKLADLKLTPQGFSINVAFESHSPQMIYLASPTVQDPARLLLEYKDQVVPLGKVTQKALFQHFHLDELSPNQKQTWWLEFFATFQQNNIVIPTRDGDISIPMNEPFRLALQIPSSSADMFRPEVLSDYELEEVVWFQGVPQTDWLEVKGLKKVLLRNSSRVSSL